MTLFKCTWEGSTKCQGLALECVPQSTLKQPASAYPADIQFPHFLLSTKLFQLIATPSSSFLLPFLAVFFCCFELTFKASQAKSVTPQCRCSRGVACSQSCCHPVQCRPAPPQSAWIASTSCTMATMQKNLDPKLRKS